MATVEELARSVEELERKVAALNGVLTGATVIEHLRARTGYMEVLPHEVALLRRTTTQAVGQASWTKITAMDELVISEGLVYDETSHEYIQLSGPEEGALWLVMAAINAAEDADADRGMKVVLTYPDATTEEYLLQQLGSTASGVSMMSGSRLVQLKAGENSAKAELYYWQDAAASIDVTLAELGVVRVR